MSSSADPATGPLLNDGQNKGAIIRPNFSSLPLQMAVYFGYHYAPFFFILNICLFVYKAIRYYYPGRFLGWELTTIFLYIFIEEVRLMMVSKGNKTSTLRPFLMSLLLGIPIVILHAYYIAAQTYVLRVDVVINAIAFVFVGLELLFSLMVMLNIFTSSTRYGLDQVVGFLIYSDGQVRAYKASHVPNSIMHEGIDRFHVQHIIDIFQLNADN